MKTILIPLVVVACAISAAAADLTRIADSSVWRLHHSEAKLVEEAGKKFVRLDGRAKHGVAWLVGSDLHEGTIEAELRGRNLPGRSFVGLAFRGVDDATHDVVYFRAFNFKNEDPERRKRAVQYISWPQHTWEKLRAQSPGKYEQPVSPAPEPDGWFRVRLVIEAKKISVFVNGATSPCLVVRPLSERSGGMVGLWVDSGTVGDFANLKITPKKT